MRYLKPLVYGALVFALGALVAVFIMGQRARSYSSDWIDVRAPIETGRITTSTEVFVGADLPAPNFKSLVGRIKFLEEVDADSGNVRVGYKLSMETTAFDPSKIPQKYREDKKVVVSGKELTELAIERVEHEVEFTITLFDKDGFALIRAKTPTHQISSGLSQELQGISKKKVPLSLARRVAYATLDTHIIKCVSCK